MTPLPSLTSSNCDEVFARRAIHLDVALAEMVFVFTQGQIPVFLGLEADQRLAVPPSLLAEAEGHTTPENKGVSAN